MLQWKPELIIYPPMWISIRKPLGILMVSYNGYEISCKYTLQGIYLFTTKERSKVTVTRRRWNSKHGIYIQKTSSELKRVSIIQHWKKNMNWQSICAVYRQAVERIHQLKFFFNHRFLSTCLSCMTIESIDKYAQIYWILIIIFASGFVSYLANDLIHNRPSAWCS